MVVDAGVRLTVEQDSLIVGSLLGDGSMRCKANALLEMNHSADQRSYVDWKYGVLSDLVSTPPQLRSTNGSRMAYRFVTRSLPALTPYCRTFYPLGQKIVPDVEISPLALDVWLMDDGCRSYRAVYLNTQQFPLADQMCLIHMLERQFSIVARVNRDKTY
ncbi:MAG: hypothetical protein ACRDGT_03145 [Candidatus Limnocylindria bacterium]